MHIIGEGASELVHIGQAVMTLGGKVDYFVDTVFNYPTLAECYKVAAFNGMNRVSSSNEASGPAGGGVMAKTIGVVLSERIVAGLIVDHKMGAGCGVFPRRATSDRRWR